MLSQVFTLKMLKKSAMTLATPGFVGDMVTNLNKNVNIFYTFTKVVQLNLLESIHIQVTNSKLSYVRIKNPKRERSLTAVIVYS